MKMGMVTIPARVMQLWFLPAGISAYLTNLDVRGLILLVVNLAVSGLIWYPFFKVYDLQELKKEESELQEETVIEAKEQTVM